MTTFRDLFEEDKIMDRDTQGRSLTWSSARKRIRHVVDTLKSKNFETHVDDYPRNLVMGRGSIHVKIWHTQDSPTVKMSKDRGQNWTTMSMKGIKNYAETIK